MTFKQYILENIDRYNPEYAEGNTDHFPMALFALQEIGGTEDELLQFYETYIERLEVKNTTFQTKIGNSLMDFFTQHELFDQCRIWITEEIENKGVEQVLRDVLSQTVGGMCTAAFHTIIRLAYAVEMNVNEEIAAALAYYITRADTIETLPSLLNVLPEGHDLLSVLDRLRLESTITYPKVGGSIFKKVNDIAVQEAFQKFCSEHIPTEVSIEDISEVAMNIYINTKDFLSLHLVTSSHALRVLLPYIDNKTEACRALLIGHLAGYVSLQKPEIDRNIAKNNADKSQSPTWEELFALARATNDDHSFKFIYTCFQESKVYVKRNYNYCASLRVIV